MCFCDAFLEVDVPKRGTNTKPLKEEYEQDKSEKERLRKVCFLLFIC